MPGETCSLLAHRLLAGCVVSLAGLLVASCGDDKGRATTTTTTSIDQTGSPPEDQVIKDGRCDPAAAIINDEDFGLVAVIEGIDVGDGQGPSDGISCTFTLVRPPETMNEPQVRTFDVTASGQATERT